MTDALRVSFRPIFHDPSGRRGRTMRSLIFGAMALALLLSGSLAIGVLNPPVVEPLPLRAAGGVAGQTG